MVFRRNEQGSMVVEASLILPIFLSLLLFLITLIRISTVEIALNHGVSEATKQVAAHMYPVALGLDRFSEGEAEDQLAAYSNFFTEEISQLLHIRQDMEDGVVADYDRILSRIFQPYVDLFIDDRMVYLEHLQVTKVTLPFGRDAAYFGLEVRYDMPLHIPFINNRSYLNTRPMNGYGLATPKRLLLYPNHHLVKVIRKKVKMIRRKK